MDISMLSVFLAGVLTFFAPCVLPVYPLYLSYLTGINIKDLTENQKEHQTKILLHSVFFVLGLSTVFFAIGFSSSLIGDLIFDYGYILKYIGGFTLIFMGLFLMGIIKVDTFFKERRLEVKKKPTGIANSYLVGLSFAAGWTPCIGPVLASVYALALNYPTKSMLLISVYNIGFAIPFIVLSFFVKHLSRLNKHMNKIQKINGIIFIVMGVLLITGQLEKISLDLTRSFGDSWF